MAIIEMKKLSLLALRSDQEALLRAMQRLRCVQIVTLEEDFAPFLGEGGDSDATALQARVRWAISELSRYGGEKPGLIASLRGKPVLTPERRDEVLEKQGALMDVVSATEACERRSGEARTALARIAAAQEQWSPWQPLRTPLETIGATRNTRSELVTLPLKELEPLREAIDVGGLPATFDIVSQGAASANLLLAYHVEIAGPMGELLRERNASLVSTGGMTGTVQAHLDALLEEQREVDRERDAIREELTLLSAQVGELKVLHDLRQAQVAREAASARFAHTRDTFFALAWVPAPQAEAVERVLHELAPSCATSFADPLAEEKPPTLLHNGRVVSNFEGIVKNFSLPDPRGLDPTFMMTPFFACFFGMMLSDAGYGIVLALLLPLLAFVIKPKRGEKKMLYVLGIGGLFTIFWGAMFDTWFGANVRPMLLNPLEQPLQMMALCLGVGAVHLLTGLGIAAYLNIKRKKPLDALFDQGFWVLLLLGLGMLALPQTSGVGMWMAIAGVAGIILTAGRAKKNIFSRLIGGLGSLYNITGWISDLLSYARLFGMGLATGVIGMVINMLVGMIMTNPIGIIIGIPILIFGHAFNMAINTLGAYVHACRLQYIEFFNKFYEDGGRPFTPLSDDARYIDLSEVD